MRIVRDIVLVLAVGLEELRGEVADGAHQGARSGAVAAHRGADADVAHFVV